MRPRRRGGCAWPPSRGIPSRRVNSAACYAEGRGVERDLVAALTWFSLAALQVSGAEGAAIAQARDGVAAGMTAEQVARAEANVRARLSGSAGEP